MMNKIFTKLFPTESLESDTLIHSSCKRLSWIQWEHLIEYNDLNKDNLTALAVDAIKKLDDIKCPNGKLNLIKEVYAIASQNLQLYKSNYDKNDLLRYLIFFIIHSQSSRLLSNYHYVKLYADFSIENVSLSDFEKNYELIFNILKDLTLLREMLLVNMTENEFNHLCSDKESEINLSRSSDYSWHNLSISMK